jgi:hypothetical protein
MRPGPDTKPPPVFFANGTTPGGLANPPGSGQGEPGPEARTLAYCAGRPAGRWGAVS